MPETARAFWKGSLRLSLVFIPVRLVSAQDSSAKLQMHQVDRNTGQRIRYQKVTADGTVVDKDDIVSGYKTENGKYILLESEEFDALKLESRHTIELTQFVDHCEIDPLYFERPYYLLPDGENAEEGYAVIRDALRKSRKMAIGQLTMRGRENLVALEAYGNGLAVQTLRYDEEFRDDERIFDGLDDVEVRDDLVKMAVSLIEEKSAAFDPAKFKDNYATALRRLVSEKVRKGKVVDVSGDDDQDRPANVVDFMEALKKSVAESGKNTKAASRAKTSAAKKSKSAPARRSKKPTSRKRASK